MHKLARKIGLNDFGAFNFVDCTDLRAPKFEHGEPRHLGTAKKSQSGMFDANEDLEDVCVEIVRKVQGIALKYDAAHLVFVCHSGRLRSVALSEITANILRRVGHNVPDVSHMSSFWWHNAQCMKAARKRHRETCYLCQPAQVEAYLPTAAERVL